MPDKELASRLRQARESLGLSLIEAAKRLGFPNYQTLRNIETGERAIKVTELSRFSKVYFSSMSKLLGTSEIKPAEGFLWRNPPAVENKKRQVEAELSYRCEQYRILEKLLNQEVYRGFLDVSIADIRTNNDINNLAERCRNLLGLGNKPAFTLHKALEQDFGVKVLFYSLSEGSSASMIHPDLGAVIIINSDEAPWRRNYDLAHELFHLITWKAIPQEDLKDRGFFEDVEKKADRFSSMILLPEQEVRREISKRIETEHQLTFSDLTDIAIEFGVSTVALLYRLAYLRFIKWEEADDLARDEGLLRLSKRRRGQEWGPPPVTERFYSLAIRSLRKGLISRGKFAEMAGIDRSEIDHFIEKTGMAVSEGRPLEIVAS
jgi:Zn-dependent peptidase ImmA (M78 family)/transcriptional regulator with XRE-family HTH domain